MTRQPRSGRRASSDWDEYFTGDENGLFQRLLMFHRRRFIAPATARHFDRVFPDSGVFVEAGSGTSESSRDIPVRDRVLVALDLSFVVLHRFNVLPIRVQGDIQRLPLADESVSGIWNLGVMEHFTDDAIAEVLAEFRRVLVADGRLLILWPPWYALHELILNTVSRLAHFFFRKTIVFFPDEVNLYRTRKRAARIFKLGGFEIEETVFGWRDLFSYVAVVAAKRPAQPIVEVL